jgi:primosomal protein N' (replication factor Y)
VYVSVVIQNSTREFDKFYDYIVPDNMKDCIRPGVRVIVPFGKGNRLCEAFVMAVKETSEFSGLKEISQIIDETPVLSDELIELSKYMRKRYVCTYDMAIRCMLPTGLGLLFREDVILMSADRVDLDRDEQEIIKVLSDNNGKISVEDLTQIVNRPVRKILNQLIEKNVVRIKSHVQMKARAKTEKNACPAMDEEEFWELVENNNVKNLNYIRIMEILYEEGSISVAELNALGFSQNTLNNMKKKGYIAFYDAEVERNPFEYDDAPETLPLPPTPSQKKALDIIYEAMETGGFQEILLHGVTGSGKTEVYMQAIAKTIEKGKNAILLVPEIGLTPQTVRRFKGRFGNQIALLHSRLSIGERFDQWRRIKNGEARVVIGARSAVFAPLDNIGIIVIDEEHETSYKSDRTPKYDARGIATFRCRYNNALLIYGSATPSIENYYRARTGKIKLVEMNERTNNLPLPEIITVDMRKEPDMGSKNGISTVLTRELIKNKEAGEQSIIFINRRGYSNFVQCRNCGYIVLCPYCSVSLTYHQAEKKLVCHYCSFVTAKPSVCPECKSNNIDLHGIGTQKVEEQIPQIRSDISVIRMDMDTTTGKRGHEKILDTFRNNKIDVLVGTQMIAKGHDFPDVTLVGILSADSLLGSGDYKATERTFQLITQAAGRAGRAGRHGRVVLQTYNPDNFSIQAAIKQDYKEFYRQEIALRKMLKLPPFYQLGLVQVSSKKSEAAMEIIKKIHSDIINNMNLNEGMFVSDPAPSPLAKLRNQYRWRIVLKHPRIKNMTNILEWIYDKYNNSRKKEWTVSVDINPYSMI